MFENPWFRQIPIKVRISCTGSSSPRNTFYFVLFLMRTYYRLCCWWCCLFSFYEVGFIRRQANSRVCSGNMRPGAACPCVRSLLKIRTSTETSWAGSNSCLNTFYFCCFLKKGGLHAVSWCFFRNARCNWCGGGLQVTGLATRRLCGLASKGYRW